MYGGPEDTGDKIILDNIKMALREIEWEAVEWIQLAQVRAQWLGLVNMVMNFRVP
jgi:hypothetical protein